LVPEFNYDVGVEDQVKLSDGSLIYSNEYINNSELNIVTGMHDYKIKEGSWFDDHSVRIFTSLVNYLKSNFKIIFVMTPYHPAVWKHEDQPVVKAMEIVEKKVHEIAKKLNVQVLGSYNPGKVGCVSDQFYDAMHPKDECLTLLENVVY